MKRVLLAIPSKGRAADIPRFLGRWLKRSQLFDTVVFVEPVEIKAYQEVCRNFASIVHIGDHDRGLGFSKTRIRSVAEAMEYEFIVKMDDDINGLCGATRRLEVANSMAILDKAITDCIDMFDENPVVKGIVFLYCNQMFEMEKWVGGNRRFNTMYMTRTEDFHADEKISFYEDFVAGIDIINRGGKTLTCGLMDGNMGYKGGLVRAVNNSIDLGPRDEEEMARIRKIYPWLNVKRVEGKPWRYEAEFRSAAIGGNVSLLNG